MNLGDVFMNEIKLSDLHSKNDTDLLDKFSDYSIVYSVEKNLPHIEFSLKSCKLCVDDIPYAFEVVEQFKRELENFVDFINLNECKV